MSSSTRKGFSILIFLFLAVLGGALYFLLKDMQHPEVLVSPQQPAVSPSTEFLIEACDEGSGIKSMNISVRQGDAEFPVLEKSYPKAQLKIFEKASLQNVQLDNGPFTLVVSVQDDSYANFGKGNRVRLEQPYDFDSIPPKLILQGIIQNINQGGAGAVAYSLNEDGVSSGVYVRDMFFPGYQQENGTYACLFPFPYYMTPDSFRAVLVATDQAGNSSNLSLNVNAIGKKFRADNINLPDSFLDSKMPEFQQSVPGNMSNLERFLQVNRIVRTANRDALHGISRDTSPTPLWHGTFQRMPRAATKAQFGDHRTYIYQGREVDNQIHLGVDLASVRHADIPAANDGRVVFADIMGIYGLVVIIDHGLGLQSLYGHLSQMFVAKGDIVKKGQVVGKSGISGLAGGDHLHFGIILGGTPVNPVEWWDPHWLRVSLQDILPQALTKETQ